MFYLALINHLSNIASVQFDGQPVNSNTATTNLLLAPILTKAVDKLTAHVGEIITYTVTILNASLDAMTNLPFTDAVPAGATYIVDTFELNGTPASPTVTNNVITYTIPTVAALGTATIEFQATVVGGEQ